MLVRGFLLAVRRPALPILIFATGGQLSLALPWWLGNEPLQRPACAWAALALFVLACAIGAVGSLGEGGRVARTGRLAPISAAAPLLFLVVMALWRYASAVPLAGYDVIALVSLAWTALLGTMRQVLVTFAGLAVVLLGPIAIIGPPQYRTGELRDLVITVVFAGLIAPTAQYLVGQLDRQSARLDAVLRAATEHSVIACDLAGAITVFNPGAERMLGWSADEVLGREVLDVVHDRFEVNRRARELGVPPGLAVLTHSITAAGGSETRDWTYLTSTGERLTVAVTVTGIRNADGLLVGYMALATDVTEARVMVSSLEEQRRIHRMLIDHLPDTTVSVLDAQLRCQTMGGHWPVRAGIDPESLVGKHIGEFFEPEDREAGIATYQSGLFENRVTELELATGHTYRFEAVPLVGGSGERYVLSVARDVSASRKVERERELATEALAVSEAGFRNAFDAAPIGIAVTSLVDAAERFVRVNQAFAVMLGRRPEDFTDAPVEDFVHPEDRGQSPESSTDVDEVRQLRKRYMHAAGYPVWTEVTYAVVRDRAGAPVQVVKHIQDIRTRKESERALLEALENQRAATQGLRELDKIRQDVISTMSHELRTPLTSIHGYLGLLADELLTPHQRQMINVALRNAERLSALVDDLLVLGRLEAAENRATMPRAAVSLTDTVRAALDTIRPQLSDKGQRLVTRIAPVAATVEGDAEQLHRALLNLLTNASKYTPDGGTVEVGLEVVGARVRISISDSGIGIPEDEQSHLFERFFRASTARDQSISGTGLGLAIVKSIVELHDGTITVESAPQRGSRFTIEVPLAVELASAGLRIP